MNHGEESRTFTVVLRALSAPWFRQQDLFRIRWGGSEEAISLGLRTYYTRIEGEEVPLPEDLWVEATGKAASIEDAVQRFAGAAGSVLPIISLACNAAIEQMDVHLAFETTPQKGERDFLQAQRPPSQGVLHQGRRIAIDHLESVMAPLQDHKERGRLMRGIVQYSLALRHWRLGHETLSLAHLYMGMEAIGKAALREWLRQKDIDVDNNEQAATELGVDIRDLHPCQRLSTTIESAFRQKVLFQEDSRCHQAAKRASDGLEHGFLPFSEIREHAKAARNKTAKYLRTAIFDVLGVDGAMREALDSKEPLGYWPVVKYVRGTLVGEGDQLASPHYEYPHLEWKTKVKPVSIGEEIRVSMDEKFTVHIGEGIGFKPDSFEVWGP